MAITVSWFSSVLTTIDRLQFSLLFFTRLNVGDALKALASTFQVAGKKLEKAITEKKKVGGPISDSHSVCLQHKSVGITICHHLPPVITQLRQSIEQSSV